jgi:hypothetical protein
MTDVVLEHLVMSARSQTLALLTETGRLDAGVDPVAEGFALFPDALSHSTSWRFEDGAVVLTFVHVLPDGTELPGSWSGPADALERLPVACHAVRHLHFLRHTDTTIAAAPGMSAFWDFAAQVADQHYPAVAGLLADHDLMDFSI